MEGCQTTIRRNTSANLKPQLITEHFMCFIECSYVPLTPFLTRLIACSGQGHDNGIPDGLVRRLDPHVGLGSLNSYLQLVAFDFLDF